MRKQWGKRLLIAAGLLVVNANALACTDLPGLENFIENSPAPIDEVFVLAMNRLGYGVDPNSLDFNAAKIREAERVLGRKFAAKYVADAIRESFQVADKMYQPSLDAAEKLYPNTYSLDLSGVMSRFLALHGQGGIDGIHLSQKYAKSVAAAMRARKLDAALNVRQFNVGEKLGDFFFNHFNTDQLKGHTVALAMPDYEMQLRKQVCGTFRNMLLISASHPAMIGYLDNQKNSANEVDAGGNVTKVRINENYGREVIELHTLGTGPIVRFDEAGQPVYAYQQEEVYQSARVLSGWHYRLPNAATGAKYEFLFSDKENDQGKKTFPTLFKELYGGPVSYGPGLPQAVQFLSDLTRLTRTKRNICRQLALSLMGRGPSESQMQACVAAYGEQGELPKMYEALILNTDFWNPADNASGFKTPLEYSVSMYRALGYAGHLELSEANPQFYVNMIANIESMGLPLFRVGPPTGYKIGRSYWASPSVINYGMNGAFRASSYVQVVYNGFYGQELENYFANLSPESGKTKEQTQVDKAVLEIAPAFPQSGAIGLKARFVSILKAGQADTKSAQKLPLRTILTQLVSSAMFMKK